MRSVIESPRRPNERVKGRHLATETPRMTGFPLRHVRTGKRRGLSFLILPLALAAAIGGTVTGAASPAAATGTTVYAHPGDNLGNLFRALTPGQTLRITSGTYNSGDIWVPSGHGGTSAAPIKVAAADPANPPLIKGAIILWDPHYWILQQLRVQATVAEKGALTIAGGVGWRVSGSEFFGARNTGSYGNVAISTGHSGPPRGFWFAGNCVHGAANTTRVNTDHNIYVNFGGNSSSSGQIYRNIIFDHPNGVGIKLGNGGTAGALGPWGVQVLYNTIGKGGRQILLHGNVRNNLLQGNLLAYSTEPFRTNPKTTAIYANMVTTTTNRYGHNYVYGASMVLFDSNKVMTSLGDNSLRVNPVFNGTTCSTWRAQATPALPYGRYGTARY